MLAVHDTHGCTALTNYVENPEAASKRQSTTPVSTLPPLPLAVTPVEHKGKGEEAAAKAGVSALKEVEVPIAADAACGAGAMPVSNKESGGVASVPHRGRGRKRRGKR
jgi:hypothetical protein